MVKFDSKYDDISIRQIGTSVCIREEWIGWKYQHTLQVGFGGNLTQFQHPSFYKELSDKELLLDLRYFIEDGTGTEKGFEQYCKEFAFDTWGFEPDETDPTTGYNKKSLKAFKRSEKRRAQAERIGITLDMAYDIVEEIQEKEYSHKGDISFISLY